MFNSITDDIKSSFHSGNMVVRLIIINIAVFVITALIQAFTPVFYQELLTYIALPGDPIQILFKPWTLITHMFLHAGLWHLIWNMLIFYWFGNIAGDLLGDKKIFPVYILGGLVGAFSFVMSYHLLPGIGSMAMGASAAVLAIVFMAVMTAPDYIISLILLGDVRIKFIGLAILFLDIIGVKADENSGGHIAHLGGSMFGLFFVYLLRKGIDLSTYFFDFFNFFKFSSKGTKKTKLKVAHRASQISPKGNESTRSIGLENQVDEILDKIKKKGYDSLTDIEKDILYKASKN
jgi:membrane associated rhomboid family serine protease